MWIGWFLGAVVSRSGSADSVEKFGPCGTMALPVFGSAEEVNRAAEEEEHTGEVGFGFGDGYDKGSGAGEITVDESFSY